MLDTAGNQELAPGAIDLPAFLDAEDRGRRRLVERCRSLIDGETPAYVPTAGAARSNARAHAKSRSTLESATLSVESARSDSDGRPAPPLPDELRVLAQRAATAAGMPLEPDVCILNYYAADGRMGLHQDKDESPESIASGAPVVSVSVGDTARFLFGG